MAYGEQIFTNLGAVQAPDASQSTAFAGSTPFAFSEGTNQLLNQVTQQAVKRREDEVKMYNDNLQAALSKASNIAEGLSAQDYDEAKSKSKKAIKYIYDNPQILLGKDPEKSNEFNNMLVDIASYTQLSKATKKIEDNYNDLIKKDSDWNNEVNNYYLQQYRNTTDPNERAKSTFVPIKNPINDFNNITYPKIVAASETETVTLPDPNDAGTLVINQKKKIDKNVFSEAFKRDNGMYLTEEWNIHPEIHGEYPTPELYIQSKIEKVYKPEFVTTSKTKNLVEYQEAQKNARNEASIEGRATISASNNAVRLQIASEKASSKNPELKNISPILSNIEGLESNILNTTENSKETPFYLGQAGKDVKGGIPEIQKVQEVNPTYVNEKIIKGIYPKGAAQYGDAYGKLYIITDKNGNKYYTPAKEIYKIKGKEVSKDEYEEAQKIGSKNISKEVLPNNSKGTQYTKETLLGSAVDNTVNGGYEYDIWKNANSEVESIKSESNSKGTYKGVNEMFYTPIGITVDRGVERKGTLSNPKEAAQHNDHVHLAFDNSDVAVEIMDEAKRRGLSVRGNPYAGTNTHSKNTSLGRASAHGLSFGNGVGKGADIGHENTDKERRDFFVWVQENYGGGKQIEKSDAIRNDGTNKGNGYFGVLKMKDGSGKVASEISIGVEFNGKETEIPTLVPTLTESEKNWLLKGNNPNDKSVIGETIVNKAIAHAKKRMEDGKSPFNDTPDKPYDYKSKSVDKNSAINKIRIKAGLKPI